MNDDDSLRLHPVWGPVDKGVPAIVEDIRGREKDLTLERNGQAWVKHKSSMAPVDFLDNVSRDDA